MTDEELITEAKRRRWLYYSGPLHYSGPPSKPVEMWAPTPLISALADRLEKLREAHGIAVLYIEDLAEHSEQEVERKNAARILRTMKAVMLEGREGESDG